MSEAKITAPARDAKSVQGLYGFRLIGSESYLCKKTTLMKTKDNSRRRFVLLSKDGPIGVSLTIEEIKAVNDMQAKFPNKYRGAKGVLKAVADSKDGDSDL